MEIAPNSTIILISGVPLDNTYTDTMFFMNEASQRQHFLGYQNKHTFTQQTYQRIKKGIARIDAALDDIFDCNYMMFQNTSYGSKWFYAFITSMEFVNNTTTDVFFELDVMQTFLFDYTLEHCFVERETPASDDLGEHIYPEDLPVGSIVCHHQYVPNSLREISSDLKPVICMSAIES